MVVCGGGGRFSLAKFLSVSIPCFMQSHTKPGTAAPHGVLADDMTTSPRDPGPSIRESCLAHGVGGACGFGHLDPPPEA